MRHALALAVAAAAMLLPACVDSTTYNGLELVPPSQAPELRLTSANGELFDLAEQEGKVVLLFFGFTNCPDICPTTLADWSRAYDELGNRADRVEWVFITVDPERDTPEIADRYAKNFNPNFIGLSPDSAGLAAIGRRFQVNFWREPLDDEGSQYAMAHSAQSFLVDRNGMVRLLYPHGFAASELAEDLRKLAR